MKVRPPVCLHRACSRVQAQAAACEELQKVRIRYRDVWLYTYDQAHLSGNHQRREADVQPTIPCVPRDALRSCDRRGCKRCKGCRSSGGVVSRASDHLLFGCQNPMFIYAADE